MDDVRAKANTLWRLLKMEELPLATVVLGFVIVDGTATEEILKVVAEAVAAMSVGATSIVDSKSPVLEAFETSCCKS